MSDPDWWTRELADSKVRHDVKRGLRSVGRVARQALGMAAPKDVMDLAEVADAAGWTIGSARQLYYRSRRNRETGAVSRTDLPAPLRMVSGRYPIWARSTIEDWIRRRDKLCKQCGVPVPSRLPAGWSVECARCAGLEGEV
ncbi:helix-turn-helix DNA binding domain protein [Gordonia phage Clown]|uniref:Helix-turn-helix DNA binding domain protein n=1 Tax=Gordonia phage Clown TaxID=2759393 RepID=A0A7L7SIY2_9CAUD|nr:helix-turn-helix DNA binding domain protein [Gordonia phage Clown]QOC56090.1 helix-turn-helix DNA binding domain protein [Gordonia phage Clown]